MGSTVGKLAIAYNADSDHKGWVTATCNSIRDVLGCRLCRHTDPGLRHLPPEDR